MTRLLVVLAALVFPLVSSASSVDQVVMDPSLSSPGVKSSDPTLFDLLTIERSASIFFSYARETEISKLFAEDDAAITLLVPTDRAVMALARKPHQDRTPTGEIELSEQELDERSKDNVLRWISVHVIPEHPINILSHTYPTFASGINVTFEEMPGDPSAPSWTRVLVQGDVHILQKREARNGVFYLIDDTIKD